MSKEAIKLSIKRVFTDRSFLGLIALVILTGIIYLVVTGFSIQASDVTVYSRYTAFGEAHFYKNHWQYLLGFVGFGIIVVAFHIMAMIKLHNLDRRQTALFVGWMGILLLALAASYALGVMRLGQSV